MAVVFKCAHCRRRLAVSRRRAGTEITCPVCATPVSVPAPETAISLRTPEPVAPAAPGDSRPSLAVASAPETNEVAPPPKPAVPRTPLINKKLVAIAAAAGVFLVVSMAIGGVLLSRGHTSQPAVTIVTVPAPEAAPESDEPLPPEDPVFVEALPERTPVAAAVEPPMEYVPLLVKRRDKLSDEDLRKQLIQVPEMRMYNSVFEDNEPRRPGEVRVRGSELGFQRRLANMKLHESVAMIEKRPDLAGLPLLKGADCQLGKEPADDLQSNSRKVRDAMARANQRDPDAAALAVREVLTVAGQGNIVYRPNQKTRALERTIPTMMQMLVPENQTVRQVLVDHLASIKTPGATKALARIAIFDLSEKLRLDALEALRERPPEDYRQVLLDGLRYVWAPVAEHAAEALVALHDVDAVPKLRELAIAPDPRAPIFDAATGTYAQKELVRINHLRNCMMCHAASQAPTDLVRGRVPTPGQPLPPLSQYYESNEGIFVRADVTYIRQDFSIPQPVDNAAPWPTMQRFDYVVRNAPLPANTDIEKLRLRYSNDYPQRDAVLYALKELSDQGRPTKDDLTKGLDRK
jgi:hypothetical protein